MTTTERIKTTIQGFLATAMSLVFIGTGIYSLFDCIQIASYLPVTAAVESIQGNFPGSTKITVVFSYSVQGIQYSHTDSASNRTKGSFYFNKLQQYKVGQELTLYYDPTNPKKCSDSNIPTAAGLAFSILGLSFFWASINIFWFGLTGKGLVRLKSPSPNSDPLPKGSAFFFFGIGLVGGAVQMIFSENIAWPWDLVAGLTMIFIVLPATYIAGNYFRKRRRIAKIYTMRNISNDIREHSP